jgi:hypothetical protein
MSTFLQFYRKISNLLKINDKKPQLIKKYRSAYTKFPACVKIAFIASPRSIYAFCIVTRSEPESEL